MRIAILSAHGSDTTYGGAEVAIHRLIGGLEGLGHEVGVITGLPPTHPQPNLLGTVTRHPWRASRARHLTNVAMDAVALPSQRLEAMLTGFRPSAALTHNLPGLSTSAWAVAHRLRIPVVHTLHDYYLLCRRTTLTRRGGGSCGTLGFCALRRRSILRYASAIGYVFAPSQFVADRHAGLFPAAPPIEVLANPTGGDDLRSIAAPSGLRRLGYLGRLDPTKGVTLLLQTASELRQRGITLVVAGDGALRDEVVRAAELGLIEYRGRVEGEDRRRLLSECDAGIAPSLWDEPGGPTLSMAEWLEAGRPVFASLRGGHTEVARRRVGVAGFEPTNTGLLEAIATWQGPRFGQLLGQVRRDLSPSTSEHAERYVAAAESARHRVD